jgi:UDP-N-acetylmuramyl pentapeptide synthase
VQAFDGDRGIDGTSASIATPIGSFKLTTPLIGRGNLSNILAATAVGVLFEVPLARMAERAAGLRPASHRGDVVRLARGLVVIDDSYNANPTATQGALDVLRTSRVAGRRVAVLGEMLELGDRAIALHEAVNRAAAAGPLDCSWRSAALRLARWRTRRLPRASRRPASLFRNERRGSWQRGFLGACRRSGAGQGIARCADG